jgi:hypothetical protein
MSKRFERFAKMAKEEFGLTVVKSTSREGSSFESLFGVSTESIAQYELPYNISADQFGYYDEKVVMEMPEIDLPVMKYDTNNNIFLAA